MNTADFKLNAIPLFQADDKDCAECSEKATIAVLFPGEKFNYCASCFGAHYVQALKGAALEETIRTALKHMKKIDKDFIGIRMHGTGFEIIELEATDVFHSLSQRSKEVSNAGETKPNAPFGKTVQ